MALGDSLRGIEKITKLILGIISITLSIFLILLGNKFLSDLGDWYDMPQYEAYQSAIELNAADKEIRDVESEIALLQGQIDNYRKALSYAEKFYEAEKKSFDNWIATKQAAVSADNSMIIQKAKELDKYKSAQMVWEKQIFNIEESKKIKEKQRSGLEEKRSEINRKDEEKYRKALMIYGIKIFLIRLVVVLPLLALGVFLFVRYRKSKYSSLLWGYIIFSLYIFFIGLVPYLPSFGGYVRYIVGIILTVFIGYHVIKQLGLYYERKKKEIQQSSEERSRKIMHEAALKSYMAQTCPSCDHKYMSGVTEGNVLPGFCIHCGLKLFTACDKCGKINFAHFPFCWSCGNAIKKE